MSDDPDVALMLAFAKGREDAFVELYQRHRDRNVSFTGRMLGNRAQAEEAAQDVFLKLYRARESYEPRSRFSTFLYRIATNHCLNLQSRIERKLLDRERQVEAIGGPRAGEQQLELERQRLREALATALAKLPERQRAALLLVHYEGLSYREAAEAIDVTEPAIKSLIHRARGTLMVALAPTLGASPGEADHAL